MTEPTAHGKSYWDVVVAKFRRNYAAVAAVWLIGILVFVAITAPLVCNDRPFAFYGTIPEGYRKSFAQLVGPAHGTLLNLPGKFQQDSALLLKDDEAPLSKLIDYLHDEDDDEWVEFHTMFINEKSSAIPHRIHKNHPLRGAFKSLQISVTELRGQLQTDEERRLFEESLRFARANVVANFQNKLALNVEGVRTKLEELADQLDPANAQKARAFIPRYEALCGGDYLNSTPDREAFEALRAEIRGSLAIDKVTLVPHWRFPLVQALSELDAFFMTGGALWLLLFGPLSWWKLGKIQPRMRRWRIQWLLTGIPAGIAALAWWALHEEILDPVNYKSWTDDGKLVIQKAVWPVHRYHQDEMIEGVEKKEAPPSARHPLGKDHIGRDLLARILWGARISLSVGFVSTGIAVLIGVVLGAVAGYFGGAADWILSRIIEVFMCFPYFFVILALAAFLPTEGKIFYIMLALGFFQWMTIARLTRGEFIRLRRQEFVVAAQALGARGRRVIFRHVLPNALAPVLIAVSFGIAGAILAESGLSFLGFGVQEPDVSWGKILSAARTQPKTWWPLAFPGICIFLSITCYNLIGDAIRDAVDPRLKID